MGNYLDLERWPRRDAFEYFRTFDKPFFNVCVRLDVARLKAALAARDSRGLSLTLYYLALRLANEHEAFRLRLEGPRVRIYEVVHGSTTVLRSDGESFVFADLAYTPAHAPFVAGARAAIDIARTASGCFEPKVEEVARIHFTTLPWLHFTSFSHARNWGGEDSVPKLAFGRAQADGPHSWLPMSVEVHHALMDGLHVGRYVQDFEALLAAPQDWLGQQA